MNQVLSGCAVRAFLQKEQAACENKAAFEEYIRELRRPDVGNDANDLDEAGFVLDLAEPGWPDSGKWNGIFVRLHEGGELTPQERMSALHYFGTDDGDEVRPEYRLP